jgi:replication initiation and membrane attachment protein DnaB
VKTPTTAKYKCLAAFTLHAFHPKALNDCYTDVAGLLAYSLFVAFPLFLNSGFKNKQFTEFTATGIAPDFNRIPF